MTNEQAQEQRDPGVKYADAKDSISCARGSGQSGESCDRCAEVKKYSAKELAEQREDTNTADGRREFKISGWRSIEVQ